MAYDYDLICVGSGPAGQRCAIQAAKLGKRVAVIEKSPPVGGMCLGTGTIPSKTFREAVRAFSIRRSYDSGLGFDPRIKPEARELLSRVDEVIRVEAGTTVPRFWALTTGSRSRPAQKARHTGESGVFMTHQPTAGPGPRTSRFCRRGEIPRAVSHPVPGPSTSGML